MNIPDIIVIILFIAVFAAALNCQFYRRDGFQATAEIKNACTRDEECGNGDFCYMGTCWGYWKGYPMPWSNCRNPYCTSTDPYASCAASEGKCTPYCKCTMNRRLGGSIAADCFPKCGKPCLTNDDCPSGCPACSYGVCSAPNQYSPVR